MNSLISKKIIKGGDGNFYRVSTPLLLRLVGILIIGFGVWTLGAFVAIAFFGGSITNGYRGVALSANFAVIGYAIFVFIRSRQAGHLCMSAKLASPQQDGIAAPRQGQEYADRVDAEVARRLSEMGIQAKNKPTN